MYRRLLILPLCLLLVLSTDSFARSRKRNKEGAHKEGSDKKKRPDFDMFSIPEDEEEKEKKDPLELKRIVVGDRALQEVIRSGRYKVGPGDEFMVTVGGELKKTFIVFVSAQGQLVIPDIGATDVARLGLKEALQRVRETIESRFRQVEVIVTLGQPRAFPVDVLGYVERPKQYLATGVDRVSELILRAGGLASMHQPSIRNIQILRPNRKDVLASNISVDPFISDHDGPVERADLLLWQRTGDPIYNPFITDGDVILVPVRGDSIGIFGAVNIDGYYEFAEGDRISDLIQLGGKLTEGANRNYAELLRLTDGGTSTEQIKIDLEAVLAGNRRHDMMLQKGDRLHVLLERKLVTVEGEVKFPGPYPIDEGSDRLRDILQRAGGVTEEASLEQASIVRWSGDVEDPEFERLRAFPPSQLTRDQQAYMKLKTREKPGQMAIDFVRLLREGDASQNVLLSRNDRIIVPRSSKTVAVSGQVANPSTFLYNPEYGVADYIRLAGGLAKSAQKKRVRVIKGKTGKWIDADQVERVEPGDTILVPEKLPRDGWRMFMEGLVVVANIVTIISLARAITK